MKRLLFCGIILISLIACSGGNSDEGGCSSDGEGEVCIKIRVQEPIRFMEPIVIVITVTSTKDISGLGISLIISPLSIVVGEAEGPEEGIELWKGESGIDWMTNINAGGTVTIVRKVFLPVENGAYRLLVHASTPQLRAIDSLVIYQVDEELNVYLPGTEIPITQGPLQDISPELLETLQAKPTSTHFPTLTPGPTNTSTPTAWVYPPPTTPPIEAPGEGPYP